MRYSIGLILIVITAGLVSCSLDSDGELTTSKGILTNQITGKGVVGVPIEVCECSSGLSKSSMCDSLTSTLTTNGGQYEVGFKTRKGKYYKVGVGRTEEYTSFHRGYEGVGLKEGKANIVNLTTIPYQVLKIEIETSKRNKNYLQIDFSTADSEGNWLGGDVLWDTVRQHQAVSTTRYVQVLPERNYKITKVLCNRTGLRAGDYKYSDCEVEHLPSFYFPYQDTLSVRIE
ncbi:hypothetical protein [Pontibacter liquoris]|uniref:hypothetical protein n=1 Tax=Pontibacter liquoris TaxID=2905677 RepID=UPI001FA77D28|nr:hypothetical protein [Pontibacter liquoris]